jgi:hypothetical protein
MYGEKNAELRENHVWIKMLSSDRNICGERMLGWVRTLCERKDAELNLA